MRAPTKRLLVTAVLAMPLLAGTAQPAVAGGNWIEFRLSDGAPNDMRSRWDVFATGETVIARVGYLSRTFDADEGPFHLWIEVGDELEEGRPIPETALRVGTFEMSEHGAGGHARFVLPALPRGTHPFVICDDPCTTWGFGEYVQGWLTSRPTVAEANVVARIREVRATLGERIYGLHDDLRQSERRERRLEREIDALSDDFEAAQAHLARVSSAASRGDTPSGSRPLIDAAAGAWIAGALVTIGGGWLLIRRRRSIVVPDTPAELFATPPPADGAGASERVLEDLDV